MNRFARKLGCAGAALCAMALAQASTVPHSAATDTNPPPAEAFSLEGLPGKAGIGFGMPKPAGLPSTPNLLPERVGAESLFEAGERKQLDRFQTMLENARAQRATKAYPAAERTLIGLLEGRGPEEIKRPALLELAFVMQEQKEYQKAQKLLAEYVQRYPRDASVPEVLFRQAHLYREMGLINLALSKYYAVISTCLNLRLDQMDYYQKLVLRAQSEIAETYYLQGKLEEASDFFGRLLKLDAPELNRAEITYKLVRCHSGLQRNEATVGAATSFLEKYSTLSEAAEVRFLLADALKKLGRTKEALQEIMALLQTQEENAKNDPEVWRYWQQKAGNDIANQFYREGQYFSALQVYETLAQLSEAPEWQLPVWYQIGLVYENLKQPQKASEMYAKIAALESQVTEKPSIKAIVEMALWRKNYIAWEEKAVRANLEFAREPAPADL